MNRECADLGKIRNPATGRCVSRTGAIGRKVQADRNAAAARGMTGAPAHPTKKECKKQCEPDKICNPASGRCVSRTGAIGRKILDTVVPAVPIDPLPKTRSQQTVYIMVGSTGAGKTRFARRIADEKEAVVISSDAYGSSRTRIDAAVRNALRRGTDVIVNATHPTKERREEIAALARAAGATTRCVHLDVDKSTSDRRSKLEGRAKYVVSAKYFRALEPFGSECDAVEVVRENRHNAADGPSTSGTRPPVPPVVSGGNVPRAMLAHKYDDAKHRGTYLASEKLDGIRGLFYEGRLYTRSGRVIDAPQWFLDKIPRGTFDGELFVGRGKFGETSSVVMGSASNPDWARVQYRIFDDFASGDAFFKTYASLRARLPQCTDTFVPVCLEPQRSVSGRDNIQRFFDEVQTKGGEGVMLRANTVYEPGTRSQKLLKVKKMQEAEATVVGFDMDGTRIRSFECEWTVDGKKVRFKVGSGLTDAIRYGTSVRIGDTITVQFFELTQQLKPRFPVFKGVRLDV